MSVREILSRYASAQDEIFASIGGRERLDGCEAGEQSLAIRVDRIEGNPEQPRKREGYNEDSLRTLGESIRRDKQLQPIRVRYDAGKRKYVIVVGERRWRAAVLVGLATLNAIVEPAGESDQDLLTRQLAENLFRVDLCPLDRAETYRRLMDHKGWTAVQCAEYLHVTPTTVTGVLRLLEAPEEVQEKLRAGELTQSEAIAAVRTLRPKVSTAGGSAGRKGRRGTSQTYAAPNGCRIQVEHRRKIDQAVIVAALLHVVRVLGSREQGAGSAEQAGRRDTETRRRGEKP